jgi:transcriptional regulator with XRE-family HTH domain
MLEKIKRLCQEQNISISKLEKECGLGNGTIGGWANSSPSAHNLKLVADYFQKPLEYFLEE